MRAGGRAVVKAIYRKSINACLLNRLQVNGKQTVDGREGVKTANATPATIAKLLPVPLLPAALRTHICTQHSVSAIVCTRSLIVDKVLQRTYTCIRIWLRRHHPNPGRCHFLFSRCIHFDVAVECSCRLFAISSSVLTDAHRGDTSFGQCGLTHRLIYTDAYRHSWCECKCIRCCQRTGMNERLDMNASRLKVLLAATCRIEYR